MTTSLSDLGPFADFESATRAVLHFLGERTDLGLWMMTRTEDDDWIVLQAEGSGYEVADGDVFRWADSFCSLMVQDMGPQAAPQADRVPVYLEAPIGRQVPIGAYLGVPVMRANGELFDTLCAIDPSPQLQALSEELPLVRLLARLPGSIVEADLHRLEIERALETTREAANHDPLTGLLNRRGWDARLDTEERRARRYGSPAAVLVIDLDRLKAINDSLGHDAGDALLVRAADTLLATVRESDAVARVGGDEFAVLCMECDRRGGEAIEAKIRDAFAEARIAASIGWASRDPQQDLAAAVTRADRAMLAEKRGGSHDDR